MPSVSVITVTHNSAHVLPSFFYGLGDRACVDDVVVVDSGSRDPAQVRVLATDVGARFIDAAANVGYGTASNLGAHGASSEWLAFVNPDVQVLARDLVQLCEVGQKHDVDCLGPQLKDSTGVRSISVRREMAPPWRRTGLRRRREPWSAPGVLPAGCLSGCAMVVRRSAFERAGGFDENFFMFAEEVDLQKRMLDAGGRLAVVPQVHALTDGGGSSEGVTSRWAATERSVGHVRYTRKHFGAVDGVVDLAFRCLEVAFSPTFRPRRQSWCQLWQARPLSASGRPATGGSADAATSKSP